MPSARVAFLNNEKGKKELSLLPFSSFGVKCRQAFNGCS